MRRLDMFDYMGLALIGLIAALWVAHFVLPAPPPDPTRFPNGVPQPLAPFPPR